MASPYPEQILLKPTRHQSGTRYLYCSRLPPSPPNGEATVIYMHEYHVLKDCENVSVPAVGPIAQSMELEHNSFPIAEHHLIYKHGKDFTFCQNSSTVRFVGLTFIYYNNGSGICTALLDNEVQIVSPTSLQQLLHYHSKYPKIE